MSKHLTPLQVCEALIGKPEVLGPIVGLDGKSPYFWRRASEMHDAGDVRSTRHQRALLAHSEAHGLGLTADHLIRGADEAEIEDILSRLGTLVAPAFRSRRARPVLQIEAAE